MGTSQKIPTKLMHTHFMTHNRFEQKINTSKILTVRGSY